MSNHSANIVLDENEIKRDESIEVCIDIRGQEIPNLKLLTANELN